MALIHTVKKGDTLSAIAVKYSTTVTAIANANKNLISNVNNIKVGWKLTIPTANSKDYTAIGKQLEKCLSDIRNLSSYKKLMSML